MFTQYTFGVKEHSGDGTFMAVLILATIFSGIALIVGSLTWASR